MGANAKKIKTRVKSISSTMHITKAMELVASSKLKKAISNMENGRPYHYAINEIFGSVSRCKSPYTEQRKNGKCLYIVIAGDRGLAGGYNNDIFKMLVSVTESENAEILPIGKKAVEYANKHRYATITPVSSVESLTLKDCSAISVTLANRFKCGYYRTINLIYTKYGSMLSRQPMTEIILPLMTTSNISSNSGYIFFEPNLETVLDGMIPEYISGLIYEAACESFASELAARRNAMNSASENAAEMIENLNLQYNRVRQGSITQELTEIVGGIID